MRIVLHNPHITPWYKVGVNDIYNRVKGVQKYSYILDYLYSKESKVYVYIDNIAASLSCGIAEFWIWVIVNRLNPSKFKLISNLQKLKSDDIFITFLYRNFTTIDGSIGKKNERLINALSRCKAYKVAQLSHYGYNAGLGSINAGRAKIDLFISESNLAQNSDFFRHYYTWYKKDVYVMPFVPKERFKIKTDYESRRKKAVAMGTLATPITDHDFLAFFEDGILQPMRLEIFKNAERIKSVCDSYISGANAGKISNNVTVKPNAFIRYLKNFHWSIKKRMRLLSYIIRILLKKQEKVSYKGDRAYMKFDIVDTYNQYKMFVNPEECIGLPGIGFAEGMACGCAYLGLKDDPMYLNVGMKDGIHYIGYDGTIDDLCDKISYYQSHEKELETIAYNGYQHVKHTFDPDKIMTSFLKYLSSQIKER